MKSIVFLDISGHERERERGREHEHERERERERGHGHGPQNPGKPIFPPCDPHMLARTV